MSKLNRILIALLAVQIAVFVMIKLWPKPAGLVKPKAILAFDTSKVEKLAIIDGSNFDGKREQITLVKAGDKWVLEGSAYPVEGSKVPDLLGKLAAVKAGAPVSDREVHQRKLEVAKEHFQRKVTLTIAGKKPLVFFLGSSPGLKKVHLRLEGQKAVYAATPLATWDIGAAASSWVDTAYFRPERDRIVGFTLKNAKGTIHVVKREGKWHLASGEGALKQTEVNALLSTMSFVSLRNPVGKKIEAAYGLASPTVDLVVRVEKKKPQKSANTPPTSAPTTAPATTQPVVETLHLRLGAKKGTAYYAKRDASPFVVTVDSSTANALLNKTLGDLLEKKKDAKDEGKDKEGEAPKGKAAK